MKTKENKTPLTKEEILFYNENNLLTLGYHFYTFYECFNKELRKDYKTKKENKEISFSNFCFNQFATSFSKYIEKNTFLINSKEIELM